MKKKQKIPSKIPTTKTNTNRKKADETVQEEAPMTTALLKKNEFALILFGALLLTLIVFFVFFQSPDTPKPEGSTADTPVKQADPALGGDMKSSSFDDLEKRIKALEASLSENKSSKSAASGLNPLQERVNRLETAFDVKFTTLAERMETLEKKITAMKSAKMTPAARPAAKTKQIVPKTTAKKKVAATSKAPMFHTVKKGETLYSIGKKYQISVSALKKLNKLSGDATIYPGMNLLIR